MQAEVGYSDIPDSAKAGKLAAEKALNMSGRTDLCDLVLLFCTALHNQQILREAVAAVVGNSVPIYGGGAIGIITNDDYGYAGNQVGVACLWLDGGTCNVLVDDNLQKGEEFTGIRLGEGLAQLEVTPHSPVILLYDAIDSGKNAETQLVMATWILDGIEKSLGFLPNLAGAGLFGDFMLNPTSQYTGSDIRKHSAIALVFGNGLHIDSMVMHGCQPASTCYTVTKVDGPVILEINHRPALVFMNELLGSVIKPEQYPFSLLFGINSGKHWDEYREDDYANRMCFGIDYERNGIVMFEPDMVEGTEFQIMVRSLTLDYMQPKIEKLFDELNGRKPVFGFYINCAGRSAGYNGIDIEDALAVQKAVNGRVPVLGFYSGVEIASIAGRPRGLDLTGVFCLFSQDENNSFVPVAQKVLKSEVPPITSEQITPLDFANKLCEENVAKIFALNAQAIALRYELELKRRGFKLLSELAVSLKESTDYEGTFVYVAERINAALNMQRTVVLVSDKDGLFKPLVLQGFPPTEKDRLFEYALHPPEELLGSKPRIVTADDSSECCRRLGEEYRLTSFVASPIVVQRETVALLLTGRMVEQQPYLTRLSDSDLETVHAITELLGAVLVRQRLRDITIEAETDNLTGLWNRKTFRRLVENYLSSSNENYGVFFMIDLDYFKSINDTYGHVVGDAVLKVCADTMRKTLRSSDIVGRPGGDEFIIFCQGIKDISAAHNKAIQLSEALKSIVLDCGVKNITASIGVALFPQHGTTIQELYNNADIALYEAKEQGRNCYVLFDPSQQKIK